MTERRNRPLDFTERPIEPDDSPESIPLPFDDLPPATVDDLPPATVIRGEPVQIRSADGSLISEERADLAVASPVTRDDLRSELQEASTHLRRAVEARATSYRTAIDWSVVAIGVVMTGGAVLFVAIRTMPGPVPTTPPETVAASATATAAVDAAEERMKATLTFNLPEEEDSHRVALDGYRWRNVVHEFANAMRRQSKVDTEPLTPDGVRDQLFEIMENNGVDFD